MLVGQWASRSQITAVGVVLILLPIFTWGWLRASVAANRSPDDAKRRQFRQLNQRLVIDALLGVLAFAALTVIVKLFGRVGDDRLFLGFIPLALMLVLTFDVARALIAILHVK